MTEETTISVDELEAKSERLANEVVNAQKAAEVAKATFTDGIKKTPDDVNALMELSKAVIAAEGTVSTAERAVGRNQTDIDGIRYDAAFGRVTEASVALHDDVQPSAEAWFKTNAKLATEFGIDTVTTVSKREASGAVTTNVKPTGENMPKRPSTRKGGGGGGTRGTRNVTTANGQVMSCREYVAACGDQASPAAQADIAGTWEGSPVSYTNEAKRLAAKSTSDTFA